jgi:hypothetical protein
VRGGFAVGPRGAGRPGVGVFRTRVSRLVSPPWGDFPSREWPLCVGAWSRFPRVWGDPSRVDGRGFRAGGFEGRVGFAERDAGPLRLVGCPRMVQGQTLLPQVPGVPPARLIVILNHYIHNGMKIFKNNLLWKMMCVQKNHLNDELSSEKLKKCSPLY